MPHATPTKKHLAYEWQIWRGDSWYLAYRWRPLCKIQGLEGRKDAPLGSFLRRDPPSISEIAPGEPRNPPSISEIRVSIGSITQQPINGVDNAYTILGDARASTARKIPRARQSQARTTPSRARASIVVWTPLHRSHSACRIPPRSPRRSARGC